MLYNSCLARFSVRFARITRVISAWYSAGCNAVFYSSGMQGSSACPFDGSSLVCVPTRRQCVPFAAAGMLGIGGALRTQELSRRGLHHTSHTISLSVWVAQYAWYALYDLFPPSTVHPGLYGSSRYLHMRCHL